MFMNKRKKALPAPKKDNPSDAAKPKESKTIKDYDKVVKKIEVLRKDFQSITITSVLKGKSSGRYIGDRSTISFLS
jgi:hypothetical protein